MPKKVSIQRLRISEDTISIIIITPASPKVTTEYLSTWDTVRVYTESWTSTASLEPIHIFMMELLRKCYYITKYIINKYIKYEVNMYTPKCSFLGWGVILSGGNHQFPFSFEECLGKMHFCMRWSCTIWKHVSKQLRPPSGHMNSLPQFTIFHWEQQAQKS